MAMEGHRGAIHRFSLYFVPELKRTELPDWVLGFSQIKDLNCEFSDAEVQWDPEPPPTLTVAWELRNHMTGRLLATFRNKAMLQYCLEWSRAENLWDLMLVRTGRFEGLRTTPVSVVAGCYNKYSFHQEIVEHVEYMELEGHKAMGCDLWAGFFMVEAMFFYRDANTTSSDFNLAHLVRCDSALLGPEAAARAANAKIAPLLRMENFGLAKEHFVRTFLNTGRPLLRPEQTPSIEMHRVVKGVPLERFLIGDVSDILEMGSRPWARHGIKMQSNEMLTFELAHQSTPQGPPLAKFAWALFVKENLPLVIIRTYELLLTSPSAWWIPFIKQITFRPSSESKGVEMSVYFYNHPDINDFKEK